MDVDSFRKVPYWESLLICKAFFPCQLLLTKIVAYALFSQGLVLAALLYILWLRDIDRGADAGRSSKEELDNAQDKEERRFISEKEDWHIVSGGLATWRSRRRESPSEV